MRTVVFLLTIFLLVWAGIFSGCGRESSPPDDTTAPETGSPVPGGDFALAPGRAGGIRLGMLRNEVFEAYRPRQVRETDLRLEGMPSPALEIRLPGGPSDHPSLIAELTESRASVWRIRVYDPRFRTAEGIGPGSTLGEIRRVYTIDGIFTGEGNTVARVEKLGMSFVLDPSAVPEDFHRPNNPRTIPETAPIGWVLITGK
jgi:hypothetical protein